MAFWNKSDDPWDRRPGKQSAPADWSEEEKEPETGLLDQLKGWNESRKAEKAERETPPEPIPCPWCGKEMEGGYLIGAGGSRSFYWQTERPGVLNDIRDNALPIRGTGSVWNEYKTAWICRDCGKLVTDFQPPDLNTPEARTQQEYEDELRRYAEQANQREEEN